MNDLKINGQKYVVSDDIAGLTQMILHCTNKLSNDIKQIDATLQVLVGQINLLTSKGEKCSE